MTNEQKKKYLASGGVTCLYCGDYDVYEVRSESSYCRATLNTIRCGVCGKQWKDVLDLCDVLPDED